MDSMSALPVHLLQQFVRAPQVRDDDASAHDQRDVERLFLLGAGYAQAVGLDGVVKDAVVAAQAG